MGGLYIHIPLCLSKCRYCDFVSYPAHCSDDMSDYINLLEQEISLIPQDEKIHVDTIYIGGGTPSILPGVERIINIIYKYFNISAATEITIEANPATLSMDKLSRYIDAGINRLSLGVQSFIDTELELLGRRHTAIEAHEAFDMARGAGFYNINIDLIYAFPNQSQKSWEYTLKEAVNLNPEHISAYSLILEKGTELFDLVGNNALTMPDCDFSADLYYFTNEYLESRGYTRYEVSNFAREGDECRHNINYWHNGEYIGLGCAAHSHIGYRRIENQSDLTAYRNNILSGQRPVANIIENKLEDEMFETLMMGFRLTKGVDIAGFEHKFGINIFDAYSQAIKININNGLIAEKDGFLKLTPHGYDIMNSVLLDFINFHKNS